MSRERGKNYPFEAWLIMMSHAFYLTIRNSLRSLKRMGYKKIIQEKNSEWYSKLGRCKCCQSTSMGLTVGFNFRTLRWCRETVEGG